MNEFPHSRMFDSDLREILEMYNTVKGLPSDWNTFRETMTADWSELKNFVNTFFRELNVQNEINNKIDALVADGTMDALIRPIFENYNAEMKVLKTRVDNLSRLEEGSTTGDAELADGRVDYKDNLHSNIGNHIREVTSQLSSEISKFNEVFYIKENSGYFDTDGNITSADATMQEVYTDPISVVEDEKIKWNFVFSDAYDHMFWCAYMCYDINQQVIGTRTVIAPGTADIHEADGTITIPKGVSYIAFCYRTYGTQKGFTAYGYYDNVFLKKILKENIGARSDIVLLGDWNYIYHYGMSAVASRDVEVIIPSQSVFDIRHAKKLGYKCIEANLHKTSDAKYVVTHGLNGALGHDFNDLNGNDANGVVISNTTFEYLRSNYRYRSTIEKYATPITSLEEFCGEAKLQGIKVMLQYVDETSMTIARGILGDNNLFMYNAPRSVYKGTILEYLYYDTKAEILNRCRTVGKPYIYSMDNPAKFDDETLKDIVSTLHSEGFYLASAYNSNEQIEKLLRFGFDFFAKDGIAKELADNKSVIDGKVITFNEDGTVTWEAI